VLLIGIVGEAPVAAFPDGPIAPRLGKRAVQPIDEPTSYELDRDGDRIDRAPVQVGKALHRPSRSRQARIFRFRRPPQPRGWAFVDNAGSIPARGAEAVRRN